MPKVFKLQQLGNAIQQILNAVSGKAEQSDLNAHTGNGDVHVSTTEKNRWNDTYTTTEVDERIEQGGKVKTVSVNGGSAVQPDEHGNIDIEVPTDLKDLNDDATHRTVTDEEKGTWNAKQPAGDYATNLALTEGLAGKQDTVSDLETIRSGAGKGATSVQGVKMDGDDEPLTPDGDGVVAIPQPVIPDAVSSVIANNELVFQTPDGQSVKGKVGITTGADGLLHLTLTDEEGHTYSSPIAGLRVVGNALQYSNDGETWATVQTFGKLTIKYVQASDPASGDEGDLALVGSSNAYVLKVYVGGSWVSVCDFGTLDLTSDGITMVGENKTLTEKMNDIPEIDSADTSNLDIADDNGYVLARFAEGHIETKNFDSRYIGKMDENMGMGEYDEFDALFPYSIGDIVIYNGLLYKFVAEHTGEWDSLDVEQTNIINEVKTDVMVDDNDGASLDFSDEEGFVVARFNNGHVKTKNFDSEDVLQTLDALVSDKTYKYIGKKIDVAENKFDVRLFLSATSVYNDGSADHAMQASMMLDIAGLMTTIQRNSSVLLQLAHKSARTIAEVLFLVINSLPIIPISLRFMSREI